MLRTRLDIDKKQFLIDYFDSTGNQTVDGPHGRPVLYRLGHHIQSIKALGYCNFEVCSFEMKLDNPTQRLTLGLCITMVGASLDQY